MDFLLKVGNDNGNSEQDIYIENNLFRQPNVNAQITNFNSYDDDNPIAVVENIMDKILVGIQSGKISGTFLIGKSAIDSGERVNEMHVGFENKCDSDLPIINTLGTLAAYSVKKYYNENKAIPEKLAIGVEMTTALPVMEYYQDPNNKIKFENNFIEGPHIVVVHLGSKRVIVDVTFTGIFVLPEAAPVTEAIEKIKKGDKKATIFESFNKEYFADSEPIDGSYFKNKTILHVDIGEGTTELPVTEDGFPKKGFVTGRMLGAGHAIEDALNEVRTVVKNPNLKRQEVSEIIRGRKLEKWKEKTMIALRPAIEKQVTDIIHAIQEEIRKTSNDVDVVMVYGGGSILMGDILYPRLLEICNELEIQLLYITPEYAVVMNAEGLNSFVHDEVFDAIVADKKQKKLAKSGK